MQVIILSVMQAKNFQKGRGKSEEKWRRKNSTGAVHTTPINQSLLYARQLENSFPLSLFSQNLSLFFP